MAFQSATISIHGLTKNFGDKVALDDISLDIPPCLVYGLFGPNGAGRRPWSGSSRPFSSPPRGQLGLTYDVLKQPGLVRENIGVLPEDTGLYDRLNAAETLRFYGGMQGLLGQDAEDRIEKLLRMLDLYDRRNDRTAKYSRGMQQKLALARAL